MSDNTAPAGAPQPDERIDPIPARIFLFGYGLVVSLIAVGTVGGLGIEGAGLWSSLIAAAALTPVMRKLFARHRQATWAAGGDFVVAEHEARRLVADILVLLMGVILSFALFALLLTAESRAGLFPAQFDALLGGGLAAGEAAGGTFFGSSVLSNILLCFAACLMAAILKEGGMAVTIAWIGSLWGVGLVVFVTNQGDTVSFAGVIVALLSLAVTSAALTIAGAAGLFLSRGALKYGATSDKFANIRRTSVRLLSYSALFVFVAAALTMLAQSMILVRTIRSLL